MEPLHRLRTELGEYLASLDPAAVSACEARAVLDECMALGRLADAGTILVANTVAAAHQHGVAAATVELARSAGVAKAVAERVIATSKALPQLERTRSALVAGQLSRDQASLVTEAASMSPESEVGLLETAARQDLMGLRREVERVKAAAGDPAADRARAHANRNWRTWTRNGEWHAHLSGPIAEGAEIELNHRPFRDGALADARKDGRREPFGASGFDGVLDMSRAATAWARGQTADDPVDHEAAAPMKDDPSAEATDVDGDRGADGEDRNDDHPARDSWIAIDRTPAPVTGEPGAGLLPEADLGSRGGTAQTRVTPPKRLKRPKKRRWQGVVRVDASAIRRGHASAGEVCEITGVGPIDVATAVDLLGQATVRFLIKNAHDVASIATTTRYRPPELDVAVFEKGGWKCANRTCSNTAYLEWEHEDDFARSRDTSYTNGNPFCGCCHDHKTYDGWQIVHFPDGTLELVPPDPPDDPDPP